MRFVAALITLVGFVATAQSTIAADSLYATGDYSAAINAYAKEGTAKAGLQIARAYNAIGNYDKSIAQYEAVVATETDLQIARLELGKLYLKTGHYDEARKLFTGLVSVNSANPEYLYYQGEAFRELDQEVSSLVAYKKAIALDSTHLRSLFRVAKYLVVERMPSDALVYINKGLEIYADDVAMINLKGLNYFNNAQYDKAIPPFERLLELGEEKEHMYLKLAYSYFKDWEFEKAKKTYKALLQLDNSLSKPYNGLGEVYLKEQKLDSAEINYRIAIEVQDPILSMEYGALAYIARQRKDLKTALEFYKLAYEEDPSSPMAYYQVCTVADQYYKDPKIRLEYYENFQKKFKKKHPHYSETVKKRIIELKEEIHFVTN